MGIAPGGSPLSRASPSACGGHGDGRRARRRRGGATVVALTTERWRRGAWGRARGEGEGWGAHQELVGGDGEVEEELAAALLLASTHGGRRRRDEAGSVSVAPWA